MEAQNDRIVIKFKQSQQKFKLKLSPYTTTPNSSIIKIRKKHTKNSTQPSSSTSSGPTRRIKLYIANTHVTPSSPNYISPTIAQTFTPITSQTPVTGEPQQRQTYAAKKSPESPLSPRQTYGAKKRPFAQSLPSGHVHIPKLKLIFRREFEATESTREPVTAIEQTEFGGKKDNYSSISRVSGGHEEILKARAGIFLNNFDLVHRKQYDEEDLSIITKDPHSTQRKAHMMVRYAVATSKKLLTDYNLRSIVGWGACGCVLGGIRMYDSLKVAVKIIYKKSITSQIPNEIQIMRAIDNNSIVKYVEDWEDEHAFFLVTNLFGTDWNKATITNESTLASLNRAAIIVHSLLGDGRLPEMIMVGQPSFASLFDFIDFHNGWIPRPLIPKLFRSLAESIAYLHGESIVHGDIKEENILIGIENGTTTSENYLTLDINRLEDNLTAKLCDFGHAFRAKRNRKSLVRYGTRDISAPELIENLRLEERSGSSSQMTRFHGFEQDIWALGLTLYTMVHGELPQNHDQFLNGESDNFKGDWSYNCFFDPLTEKSCLDLMKRMLAIDPRRRITSVGILDHPFLKIKRHNR